MFAPPLARTAESDGATPDEVRRGQYELMVSRTLLDAIQEKRPGWHRVSRERNLGRNFESQGRLKESELTGTCDMAKNSLDRL